MFDALTSGTGHPLVLPFFILTVTSLCVAAYLAVILHRREKKADQRLKQARTDITDMTILFQTMRDIIGQQKSLAKEFNEELEHKMEQVKHILSQGMSKNKQLYDKQQKIAEELGEAQARIDSIYRQLDSTQGGTLNSPRPTPPPMQEPARPADVLPPSLAPTPAPRPTATVQGTGNGSTPSRAPGKSILDSVKSPSRPTLPTAASAEVLEKLTDTGVTKSSFTSWVAKDLSEEQPGRKVETPVAQAAPTMPTPRAPEPAMEEEASPQNGDAAREAFRALLNMPQERTSQYDPMDIPGQVASMPTMSSQEPEPTATTTMQQRVLEYSDAGMTVAEVSRELGIGKGEVRLMLSLAKQNNASTP